MASQPVKCLQMSLNVSKTSPNVSKMSPNVSIETFSPYRLHQSEIPNALPATTSLGEDSLTLSSSQRAKCVSSQSLGLSPFLWLTSR